MCVCIDRIENYLILSCFNCESKVLLNFYTMYTVYS